APFRRARALQGCTRAELFHTGRDNWQPRCRARPGRSLTATRIGGPAAPSATVRSNKDRRRTWSGLGSDLRPWSLGDATNWLARRARSTSSPDRVILRAEEEKRHDQPRTY